MQAEIPVPVTDSLEDERAEVLDSVLQALRGRTPGPDEMAACAYLLLHLSRN
jgi:hypothetical protein